MGKIGAERKGPGGGQLYGIITQLNGYGWATPGLVKTRKLTVLQFMGC